VQAPEVTRHRYLPWAREELNQAAAFYAFSIIYAERDEEIMIVAVAHQRKRPGYWRGRQ
jgi:hypothetical protein